MPLIKSSSKKAFSENVAKEMDAGKPQPQSLAIAYSVKRKAKKKMAAGGGVYAKEPLPSDEDIRSGNYHDRPDRAPEPQSDGSVGTQASAPAKSKKEQAMDSIRKSFKAEGGIVEDVNDADMLSRNRSRKPLVHDDWTDNSTIEQAQSPSPHKMSTPAQKGSDAMSMRQKELSKRESILEDLDAPAGYRRKPESSLDEAGADRQGPAVSDMASQHNNHKSPYKMAIEHEYAEDESSDNMKAKYALGGEVDHGIELEEREDEMDLQGRAYPGKHGEQPKSAYDEVDGSSYHGKSVADAIRSRQKSMDESNLYDEDMLSKHEQPDSYSKAGIINYAKGGEIPDHDIKISVSEAIRQSNKKLYAKGGPIEDSEVDLQANANEDLNEEDQLSYQAARKDTYFDDGQIDEQPMDSNESNDKLADADENGRSMLNSQRIDHEREFNDEDMISSIRRKMKSKRI